MDFQLLGYGFVPTYSKGDKGKYQLVVGKKGWARLKQKLKAITRKTTPSALDERVRDLKETQRGWIHYFRMASIQGKPKDIESWIRWQIEALHLARLEEARAEKEEPAAGRS